MSPCHVRLTRTLAYDYIRSQPKIVLILSCLVVVLLIGRLSKKPAYPPGPRGLPLLGNIFQLNNEAWVIFTKWKRQYGPPFACLL